MDLFGKKKNKELEDKVRNLTNELFYNKELLRTVVDEPDSSKAKIIHEVCREYYSSKRWRGLIIENHLGWLCDPDNILFKETLQQYFKPSKS